MAAFSGLNLDLLLCYNKYILTKCGGRKQQLPYISDQRILLTLPVR